MTAASRLCARRALLLRLKACCFVMPVYGTCAHTLRYGAAKCLAVNCLLAAWLPTTYCSAWIRTTVHSHGIARASKSQILNVRPQPGFEPPIAQCAAAQLFPPLRHACPEGWLLPSRSNEGAQSTWRHGAGDGGWCLCIPICAAVSSLVTDRNAVNLFLAW